MSEDRFYELLDHASKLSPRSLTVIIKEGEKELVNSRFPFVLVRTVMKYAKNFSSVASEYAPGMNAKELRALISAVDVDAILNDLAGGGAKLPYTLCDITDDTGKHARAVLE